MTLFKKGVGDSNEPWYWLVSARSANQLNHIKLCLHKFTTTLKTLQASPARSGQPPTPSHPKKAARQASRVPLCSPHAPISRRERSALSINAGVFTTASQRYAGPKATSPLPRKKRLKRLQLKRKLLKKLPLKRKPLRSLSKNSSLKSIKG